MAEIEMIAQLIEHYGIDSLINVITLYYMFKLGNVAIIFMEKLFNALFEIYHNLKEVSE